MQFLAPSANRLPDEHDDLRHDQFRLYGRTFSKGHLVFIKRHYFVGTKEVFFQFFAYDDSGTPSLRIAVFGSKPTDETQWNHHIAIDEAAYTTSDEKPHSRLSPADLIPLRLCLDEGILKFAPVLR